MKPSKTILISTLAISLLVLAGCATQTVTNTNAVVTNSNENTNEAVVNGNTNTDQGSEVDTSDWLTYTNDEYGFSVKYPNNWIYFHTVNEEGYATYDEFITDYVRFTDKANEYSTSSFVDITLRVSTDEPKDPAKRYIVHNAYYFIFDEGTWPNEESLRVIDQMTKTLQFDS